MLIMNLQNLQQENGVLSMIKITQTMVENSNAYLLATGDITATGGDANRRVAFKNCTQFTKCITHINDEHVNNADNLDIIMLMYNLIEYRISIQTLQEVYGSLKEINKVLTMEFLLTLIQLIQHLLNTNQVS